MTGHLTSNPDIVVYIPKGENYNDTDNEHFLVFHAPKSDELLAMWTQSKCEGFGNNHTALARSSDGVHWSQPIIIAGSKASDKSDFQASWSFPVVSRQGRIYCFYTKETEIIDVHRCCSGSMGCLYSDDNGHTWTQGADIQMQRNQYDHPDSKYPRSWIVWQKSIRDSKGRQIVGYTQSTSKAVRPEPPAGWWSADTRPLFMRFDNIDEGPDPEEIRITWLPDDPDSLHIPYPEHPNISVSQEPSIVLLPDNRLFTVMRTFTGFIWYSVSDDDGATWRKPEPLRYHDKGDCVRQPIAPCPVYSLSDGRFILIYHNNDGNLGPHKPEDAVHNRRPAYISLGTYQSQARQPIWFTDPQLLADSGPELVGPKKTCEICTYTSYTEYKDRRILWYPDKKYYLLGKYITDEMLDSLALQKTMPAGATGNPQANPEGR